MGDGAARKTGGQPAMRLFIFLNAIHVNLGRKDRWPDDIPSDA